MNWQTTYPTLATVMEASFDTLTTWDEKLPAPQTDVERTIRRRIKVKQQDRAAEQMTRDAPELAANLDAIYREAEKILGKKLPDWVRK